MNSHARLLKLGLDGDPVTATQLLKAYVTGGSPASLTYAHRVFDEVPSRAQDPVLWTALISAYARAHHPGPALRLFSQMLLGPPCPRPNHFTLASAARAAAVAGDPLLAGALHSQAIRLGLHSNVVVATSIVDMHGKCNDLTLARKMFDVMPQRNAVTWNSMIAGYTTAGMGVRALELFYWMRYEVGCDEFSVASGLTACAGLGDLRSGTQIHGYVVITGLEKDPAVPSAVANMYFRCEDIESAERAMEGREESPLSKLMMIKGYVFNGRYNDALWSIGRGDGSVEVVMTDCSVVGSVLTACAKLGLYRMGRQIHGLVVTMGCHDNNSENAAIGSALIDMYCKCSCINEARCVFDSLMEKHVSHWNSMITGFIYNGLLEEARGFFDNMPTKNVISWTTMISGYIQYGLPREGLQLLTMLHGESGFIRGNCFTLATALDACRCLAALDMGKQIHAQALRTVSKDDSNYVVVESALVDMYSKMGILNYARKVFDRMWTKNVISWTSMIGGYAYHGLGLEAVEVLEQMMSTGCEPNEVTFIAVLSACSHCGLVEQGIHYFSLMRDKYGVSPRADHYTCVVDMLGRAGRLVEAWNLVEEIKGRGGDYVKDTDVENGEGAAIQGALLGGCWLHGDVEIGSKIAKEMLKRKHQISDTYVALSNVYAAAEMWDKVYNVREEWRKQGVVKGPGHSQIHG